MINDDKYIDAWNYRVGPSQAHLEFDDIFHKKEILINEYKKGSFEEDFNNKKIIDYGCGGGLFGVWIKENFKPVFYKGFDIAKRSIISAIQNYPGVGYFELINPSECYKAMRFKADCFICFSVIQHFPDQEYLDLFLKSLNNSFNKKLFLQIRTDLKLKENIFRKEPYKTTQDIAIACYTTIAFLNKKLTNYELTDSSMIFDNGYQYLKFERIKAINAKIIPIDLDETLIVSDYELCNSCGKWKYKNPVPVQKEIDSVNRLYGKGYTIIIYTGRPWECYNVTKKQLKTFDIKYHELVMGKIPGKIIDKDALRSASEFID